MSRVSSSVVVAVLTTAIRQEMAQAGLVRRREEVRAEKGAAGAGLVLAGAIPHAKLLKHAAPWAHALIRASVPEMAIAWAE